MKLKSCYLYWSLPLIILVSSLIMAFARHGGGDFQVYLAGAERMFAGAEVYRAENTTVTAGAFTYPPFFAVPFTPFLAVPENLQRLFWNIINFSLLFLILGTLSKVLNSFSEGRDAEKGRYWVWGIALLCSGRFLVAPLENQSHDLIIMYLMLLGLKSLYFRPARAGIFVGMGAACKATPLLFLVYFCWKKFFKSIPVLLATIVVLSLIPDFFFPSQNGKLWILQWYEVFIQGMQAGEAASVSGAWKSWSILNQGLAGTISRFFICIPDTNSREPNVCLLGLSAEALKYVILGSQLLVGAMMVFFISDFSVKKLRSDSLNFLISFGYGSVVLCTMLLLSPMSSKAHFCIMLFPAIFCSWYLVYYSFDRFIVSMLAVLFVCGTLSSKGIVGRYIGNHMLAYGSVTLCAFAMLVAVGYTVRKLQRR